MANPIFGRGEGFTKHAAPQGHAQPQGYAQKGFAQKAAAQTFDPYAHQHQQYQQAPTGAVMTYDDVIAKTGVSLGAVFLIAAATFVLLPETMLMPVWIVSAIAGLITVFVVAGRRVISPLALGVYVLFEGLFIGAISKFFETLFPGIVATAVLATFVTAAATLAVMKFGNVRVGTKFRQGVTIATIAFAGVVLVNFVLALLGVNTGLREIGGGAGMLAIGISLIAIVLAVLNLVMDFDAVRRGVEARVPATESWRAALGITVTMVWLYVEILRILSYFRD
ncbi:MAG: Bax inhibitor-1/YccA family protein [Propionibacterium sp.]|nr:Bax inhibitor-1/YccA family protein [Propionibacterium sp.]